MKLSRALSNCEKSNELPRISKILKILLGEKIYEEIMLKHIMKFDEELSKDETHIKILDEYNEIFQEIHVIDPKLSSRLDDLKGNLRTMEIIFFLEKGFEMGQKQSQKLEQILFCK